LQRRLDGIKLRVNQGDISFDFARNGLQLIAEKKIFVGITDLKVTPIPFTPDFEREEKLIPFEFVITLPNTQRFGNKPKALV